MADIVVKGGGYCLLATQGDPLQSTKLVVYLRHESKRVYVVFFRREHIDQRWSLVPVEECGIEPYLVDRNFTSNFKVVKDIYRFSSNSEQHGAVIVTKMAVKGTLILE